MSPWYEKTTKYTFIKNYLSIGFKNFLAISLGFRVDFLIESDIIIELKSVEILLPVHESQILSYLRFMGKRVGLILNFNEPILKKGIRRFVLDKKSSSTSLPQGMARLISS